MTTKLVADAIPFWEISAHRGDRGAYRENSMSALIHSMEIKASSVEFDVHLTKDGVPIIYHDYTLNPVDFVNLEKPELIKNITLAEIKKLSFSSRFITKTEDTHLTTLEEFLTAVKEREQKGLPTIPLHLEIKSEKDFLHESAPVEQLAKQISLVINKIKVNTPIIARAFNWDVLIHFKNLQPKIPLILLVDKGDWKKLDFNKAILQFEPLGFAPNFSDLTEDTVRPLVQKGIQVNPWTVNAPEIADELIKIGVTGITTDFPQIFLERYQDRLNQSLCAQFYGK